MEDQNQPQPQQDDEMQIGPQAPLEGEILETQTHSRIVERRTVETVMEAAPDVLNHNTETVPRLYRQVRLGARFERSLDMLAYAKQISPRTPTKSGLMLGLGETGEEVLAVMRELRAHHVDILTLGQYLRPSPRHLPIVRYVPPAEFDEFRRAAEAMGFTHVEAGPLVRSSYHAAESVA